VRWTTLSFAKNPENGNVERIYAIAISWLPLLLFENETDNKIETCMHTKMDISPLFSVLTRKKNENQKMTQVTLYIPIEELKRPMSCT